MFGFRSRVRTRNLYTIDCVRHFHEDGSACAHPILCRRDHEARVVWRDSFENVVVTAGLNALLGNTFDAAAGSVAWYVGLIGAGTGTVSVSASSASVTGSSTSFANGDNGSDIIIVGAGAAAADFIGTVSGNPGSTTALTLNANASTTVSGAGYAIEPRAADTMSSKSFNEVTPYSNSVRPTWTKNAAPSGGAMSNSSSKAAFTVNATSRVFGAFAASDSTKGGTSGTLYGGGLFTTGGSRSIQSGDTVNVQVDLSVTSA